MLTTIKNVTVKGESIGYLAISENANEIRTAINERKNFIIRTAFVVAIVIFIFSFVLNRYFLKPIKNLVNYTNIIKMKYNFKEKYTVEDFGRVYMNGYTYGMTPHRHKDDRDSRGRGPIPGRPCCENADRSTCA